MPDGIPAAANIEFNNELSSFEYMMFRADMDARSRTSIMFIETLDAVPDYSTLRRQIDRASRLVPRLRQHVVAPLLPLAPARWVIDPDFALDYHLRHMRLPGDGSLRALLDLTEALLATPLDPGRPLWEATLIEGLDEPDAKAALVWKMSHSVTDGVGGMILDQMIHQESREPAQEPMPPIPVPKDVTPLELTRSAVRRMPLGIVTGSIHRASGALRRIGGVAKNPGGAVMSAAKTVDDLRRLAEPAPAEPSPLLRRRGLAHRFATLDFPLAQIRAAAKAHECSVNDAYLAGIAGAMRIYHDSLGMPIDELNLGMPVNVRAGADSSASNNWSAITLGLPVAEADPARRMRAIRKSVLHARSHSSIDPTALFAPLLTWMPQQLMAGAGAGSLGIDIQASNVPGKATDRFIAGSRITRSIPIGPLPGVAMMATMVSFSGQCFIGVNFDRASFTEEDILTDALDAGFAEVLALSDDATPKKTVAHKKTAAPKKTAAAKNKQANRAKPSQGGADEAGGAKPASGNPKPDSNTPETGAAGADPAKSGGK